MHAGAAPFCTPAATALRYEVTGVYVNQPASRLWCLKLATSSSVDRLTICVYLSHPL